MTWTLASSGTTSSLIIGAPTTLVTDSVDNGTFVFEIDTSALSLGDLLRVQINTITLSGGSPIQAWEAFFQHTQASNHKISPPIASDQEIQVILTQIAGTINISSLTGTVSSGVVGTGQSSGATGVMYASTGTLSGTTAQVSMLSGVYTSGETVWCTTSANDFVVNGSPAGGRTFPWKLLRV